VCRLNAGPLSAADEWLRYYERFWSVRLDRLEELLRLDPQNPAAGTAPPPSRPARARKPSKHVKSPTPRKRSSR
jgi:hypothetical protein